MWAWETSLRCTYFGAESTFIAENFLKKYLTSSENSKYSKRSVKLNVSHEWKLEQTSQAV